MVKPPRRQPQPFALSVGSRTNVSHTSLEFSKKDEKGYQVVQDIVISAESLSLFVQEILRASRADGSQGQIFVDALLWSDRIGRSTHGIWPFPDVL